MKAALTLAWRLRSAGARENRAPGLLAVTAFAVATAALLVCLAGLGAFEARSALVASAVRTDPYPDAAFLADTYVTLAWIARRAWSCPSLTLGGVAARLAVARRDQRLAALRPAGATSGHVTAMTLAEAALQALVGAAAGVVLYAAAIPLVSRLSSQGRPFDVDELIVPVWKLAAVVVGVALVAVVSGLSSLARVVVSPRRGSRPAPPRSVSACCVCCWPS